MGKITGTICLLLSMVAGASSQPIESLLSSYNNRVPQEKIYIHFDNSLYIPGQTIWYKAYLLKGNEPSDLSKNLYIDWFDENGKFVDRLIAPIINAGASGSFTIPEKVTGNHLQVLAYTKWMLNFDSAFLFHAIIPVAQAPGRQNVQPAVVTNTSLRFFPEGGDMVENIPCTIAFKAQQQGGVPANVHGIITGKNGKQITLFTSVHNGMGKIKMTPVPGETYTAEWTDPSGIKRYTALPVAKKEGVVLCIKNDGIIPEFSVEHTITDEERFAKASIVAQMNQRIVFRAAIDLTTNEKIHSSIPVSKLPSGVLQVTVFDALHRPLAERILFVNNDNYQLPAEVHTDTVNLSKHGKNVYEIDIPDSIQTSLSLAITDGEIQQNVGTNIFSNFLLSGEIKGYVHNPDYYFSSLGDSTEEHLDLVMLTNGWRRFKWEDVWADKTPSLPYEPDTSYLSVSGKIDSASISNRQIKKAGMVNMILMAKDFSRQYLFAPLRGDGSFSVNNLIFFDTTKFFYQLNKSSFPGKSNIRFNTSFLLSDSMRRIQALQSFLTDTVSFARVQQINHEQRRLDSLKNKTTLSEVTVITKRKTRLEQLDDIYATGIFSGHSSAIYEFNLIDDPEASTGNDIFDYLKNKVPGLSVNIASKVPIVSIGRKPVSFLVDEGDLAGRNPDPAEAIRRLRTIPIRQIAYVKFFPSFNGLGGAVVVIYLKKGNDRNVLFDTPLSSTILTGYTPVKEFYLPGNREQPINDSQPDLRKTVYWKPNISTEGVNTRIKIFFYNNDISHSLRVVLEGIAADGRLVHFTKLLN